MKNTVEFQIFSRSRKKNPIYKMKETVLIYKVNSTKRVVILWKQRILIF